MQGHEGGVFALHLGQAEGLADVVQAQDRCSRCIGPGVWLSAPGERGSGGDQRAGVVVARVRQYLPGRALFDHFALLHHQDAVGAVDGHPQVMGDDQQGNAPFTDQPLQVVENLALYGDVEGAGRLVGNDQAGGAGQGDGDQHALAHAAGEFMGVLAGPQDRLVDTHLLQQLDNIGIDAGVALALGQDQRLGDLLADAQGRVEADHRVLGHQPDGAPTLQAFLAFAGMG